MKKLHIVFVVIVITGSLRLLYGSKGSGLPLIPLPALRHLVDGFALGIAGVFGFLRIFMERKKTPVEFSRFKSIADLFGYGVMTLIISFYFFFVVIPLEVTK